MTEAEARVVPQWIFAVGEFQNLFGGYFPRMSNDLDVASLEMSWLHSRAWGHPIETVRQREALRELRKFKSLILRLADTELPGSFRAYFELTVLKEGLDDKFVAQPDGYLVEEQSPEISDAERKIVAAVMAIGETAGNEELSLALDTLCSRMERGIAELPETRNINWEAVHAVDCLRILWRRNTGKDGPVKALNPASSFAAFLHDGFRYLEIDADPISAFKRWAAKSSKSK